MTIMNGTSEAHNVLKSLETLDRLRGAKAELIQHLANHLALINNRLKAPDDDDPSPQVKAATLLNAVGPAQAAQAVAYSLNRCRGTLKGQYTSTDFVTNAVSVAAGEDAESYAAFTTNLETFLLPRLGGYSGGSVDAILDPKHPVNVECGYPAYITPLMYRYMYEYDETAEIVVNAYPDECWAADPEVYELEDEGIDTPFEEDWKALVNGPLQVLQSLYKFDKAVGVGYYGALLIGFDDTDDLEQPVSGVDEITGERAPGSKTLSIKYLRPLDEYLCAVLEHEVRPGPRFGLPKYYTVVFSDLRYSSPGSTTLANTRTQRVHWTRVIHGVDGDTSDPSRGVPRMRAVFPRLLDLRKVKAGSAEMMWRGGYPGIAFEIDPDFVADNPEFDKDEFKQMTRDYTTGMTRALSMIGIKANSLAPNIPNSPEKYTMIQYQAIAANKRMPLRILLGSEEGRLASSEDKVSWNSRLGRRNKRTTAPGIVRPFTDRVIAFGVVRPPKKFYYVDWPNLNAPTDEDRANLSLKWTQALSQYVASGAIHLVPPMEYLTGILGLRASQAKTIIDKVMKLGGWKKLLDVDPSKGAGVNGNRVNVAGKAGSVTRKPKPKGAGTADKKIKGQSG